MPNRTPAAPEPVDLLAALHASVLARPIARPMLPPAPALPVTPPVVWVETEPIQQVLDPDGPYVDDLRDEWLHLPQEWLDALWRLTEPDVAECAACGDPVGYRISGEADERCDWTIMVLVKVAGNPIHALCEECAGDDA